MAEVDASGQSDLRHPADAAAFVKWLAEGDTRKKLQRQRKTPNDVFVKLEKRAPIPLDE